jgi:O-antigen/teichoic acid export membrane protein
LLPGAGLCFQGADWQLFKAMVAFGVNSFLYATGALVINKASDIIIGTCLSTGAVTEYAVTMGGLLVMAEIMQSFTAAVKPAASDLDARGDIARLQEVALTTQKYSLLILIPATAFFVLLGREFLLVWMGQHFAGLSAVLAVLAVGHFARLSQYSNFLVLIGKGEHKIFGVMMMATALICVAMALVSVKVLHAGLMGIAWANSIPLIIVNGVFLSLYFCRRMGIPVHHMLRVVWRPAILGCAPTVGMMVAWKHMMVTTTWLHIGTVVVSSVALTGLGSWFLSLTSLERKRFLAMLPPWGPFRFVGKEDR